MLPVVADARVARAVRGLYMGSGALFLVTVLLGISQALFQGDISHAQILAHFHAGTIGWVTLSVIATAIWVFGTGHVSDRHASFVTGLAVLGVVAVAGYIASFWLAFSETGPFWLLPLFGVPAGLTIFGGWLVTAMGLRRQETVTTVHLLLFGALLVALLGALMGIFWGLTYSTGFDPYPAGASADAGVGAHAAPMDMYLALAFAAIVEMLLVRGPAPRWSKWGMTQMVLGVVAAFAASMSQFAGVDPLAPVGLLLFIASFLIFFFRIGRRTFTVDLKAGGRNPALFWAGIAFPLYVGLFVFLVFAYFIPGNEIPHALEVTFGHVTFLGVATNLVLAVQSARTDGSTLWPKAEPWGLWILNAGLVLFIAGEWMGERREGAVIMAIGVLIVLATVWMRLLKSGQRAVPAAA